MRWAAPALALAGLSAAFACILILNDGRFGYTLDDAYIHLSLAEGLAQGHYGVNPGEVASPSSSILWPFLLIPLAGTEAHAYVPLLWNVVFALLTAAVLQAVAGRVLDRRLARARAALAAVLTVALNTVGLAFTGMEHSLQVFLALLLAYGLIVEAEEGRVAWWLAVAVVVGPLVRYENAALSAGAILYLALRGRPWAALALAVGVAVPLVAFSVFLVHLGLDWLPASVLVKAGLAQEPGALPGSLFRRLQGFGRDLGPWDLYEAAATGLLGLLLGAGGLRRGRTRAERLLAVAGLFALAGHLALGRFGWFARYEVYLAAALVSLLLYCWRRELPRLPRGWMWAVVAALLFLPYLRATWLTPLAANNIHQQQYQMHRFATEFHRGPVAVNDLGWVSYRNEAYVLDLAALGTPEALTAARAGEAGWQERLVRERGIGLAMIYGEWASAWLPGDWARLGRLHLGGARVTPAQAAVDFYATAPAEAVELRARLEEFAATLPAGAAFDGAGGP